MCGLCGTLGGPPHWTEAGAERRRAGRLASVRITNAVLATAALRVDDWQGAAFLVAGATGRQEIVSDLQGVWEAGRMISGRSLDPLDPALLARLDQTGRET